MTTTKIKQTPTLILIILINISIIISISKTNSSSKSTLEFKANSLFLNENFKKINKSTTSINPTNKNILFAYFNIKSNEIHMKYDDEIVKNDEEILVAKASFSKKEGWNMLKIKTFNDENGVSNSIVQCYTAGYIEGSLFHQEIYDYSNNIKYFFLNTSSEDINEVNSLYEQVFFNLIEKLEDLSSYSIDSNMKYYACLFAQLNGLLIGYNESTSSKDKELKLLDIIRLSFSGNFGDFKSFISMNQIEFDEKYDFRDDLEKHFEESNIVKLYKKLLKQSKCSVITKLIKDSSGEYDILSGHATWSFYGELVRTLKSIEFEFDSKDVNSIVNSQLKILHSSKLSFSSYPGVLFSADEYYQVNESVVVLQTTLNVINKSLYKDLINVKNYIPEFIRIMSINFQSRSGKEWTEKYVSKENTMYITNWIIVDYSKLDEMNHEKKDFVNELIYTIDEVPRSIQFKDISEEFLKNTYEVSMNMPYFNESYEIMGYNKFEELHKDNIDVNPRGYIMKSLHSTIENLETFSNVISYNGFLSKARLDFDDPSKNEPSNGIMSRYDLEYRALSNFYGGIDFKITDKKHVQSGRFVAKLGPTNYGECGNFKFNDRDDMTYFKGVASEFNFNKVEFSSDF